MRQWLALSHAERMAVMAMMLALPVISLGMQLFGYVRMRRWIERASSHEAPRNAASSDIAHGERLARLAAIAGRHGPITATCLRQSLLLHFLLRRRHLSPELMIGVRRQGSVVDAHAWVQLSGIALGQRQLAHSALPEQPPLRKTA